MKAGEYWKLGESLWVHVGQIRGQSAHFDVINGAWEGRYDIDKERIYVKFTKKYHPMKAESIDGPLTREQVREQSGY